MEDFFKLIGGLIVFGALAVYSFACLFAPIGILYLCLTK